MKQFFTLFIIVFFTVCLNAQYLNVTDVYFVVDPTSSALPDTGLTPSDQLIVKIDFRNNLPNHQSLLPGDSVTFGWSIYGKRIGTLGTTSWPVELKYGQSAKIYSHENFPLPPDSCHNFEICVWPLYNPHAPNTDSTKGVYCTTFKTTGCRPSTTFIAFREEDNTHNFYVSNGTLYFKFSELTENNMVELISMDGKVRFSKRVSQEGSLKISSNKVTSGIYILKASNRKSEVYKKVFIEY